MKRFKYLEINGKKIKINKVGTTIQLKKGKPVVK